MQLVSVEEHLAHLHSAEAREIYCYLLGMFDGLPRSETVFRKNGYLYVLQSVDGEGVPYAFIVNRNDLLFYFRRPAFERVESLLTKAQESFKEAQLNSSGEVTIHIRSLQEARIA